ncbi:AMP-binding protein [Sinimarinibacterium flocculans]|uniref:AMP-binding protein n=1 Tax=Sinimarinibacterium flocculans TaxID=985250 RepID=UPI0035110AB5
MPAPTALRAPAFHAFTGRNLPWLVDAQAASRGERPYLIWEPFDATGRTWTYAQFAEETRAYAAGLAAMGVAPGTFVLVHMDNCPEFLFLWHACARLGAIAVTTNTHSTADELAYFARHSGATVAVTQPKFASLLTGLPHAFRWIAVAATDSGRAPDSPPAADLVPLARLRGNPQDAPARPPDPLAPNSVQFTSGTTSRPKGVVWTQGNALWAARTLASILELTAEDRGIVHFPLFHTNALAYSMLSTLWAGASAVLTPRFSASRFWEISVRQRCTWASMSPFPIRALLTQPDPPAHDYRVWTFAGDLAMVHERWGIRTTGWYGMTETVSACISTEQGFTGPEGAMGRPRPEYEISVRRDDGSEAGPDEPGRLYVRGVPGLSLFHEYLHDPEATAAAFDDDGWFETGDEVVARPQGELFFVGRTKDMLKVGGENVAAIEIETVIATVPGVVECAVVGKPDDMRDELPVAFVVAERPGAELEAAIRACCEDKLSAFKRPHEIRFIERLPTGLLGKILKKDLRAMLTDPQA